MKYEEWWVSIPEKVKSDPLWDSLYYRKAMYLFDLVWEDCAQLRKDPRGLEIVRQLIRSSGGICANIEEGYGRGIGTLDYIRILRIALGEARETQGWYLRARHSLPPDLIEQRLNLINEVISLLVTTISRQKQHVRNS